MNTKKSKIMVTIRKRPISKKELSKNEVDIIEKENNDGIILKELKEKLDLTKYVEEHYFVFDQVYDENNSNKDIYNSCVKDLVEYAFDGGKSTVFAYGQTGSGKTFTMMGKDNGNIPGLYLLACNDIFIKKDYKEYEDLDIQISFFDIYCGKLYDLLDNRNQLILREDGNNKVNIVGLSYVSVDNIEEILMQINRGISNRVTSATGANIDSSRSHAILNINLIKNNKFIGKISFIDLAGNERGADTYFNDAKTRLDGAEINKSLLALKECIRALDLEKKHLPFRGSKLTLVLKDSFIGKCKTVMIGCVNPCNSCCELSLNTLRYADRVKELKKGKKQSISKKNNLKNELMLPRQHNNKIKKLNIKDFKNNSKSYKEVDNKSNLLRNNSLLENKSIRNNLIPPNSEDSIDRPEPNIKVLTSYLIRK